MTFQESAKKFKAGPVAPPERDEERPDMSGAAHRAEPPPDHEPAGVGADTEMSNGAPGKLSKMPGERGRR
jgi:hypothetical protein